MMLICGACVLMARLMLLMFQDNVIPPERVQEAVATGVAAFVMFYFGSTLLFSLITGYTIRFLITEESVRYGSRYFPWRDISWIDARMRRGTLQVHLKLRRGLWRNRWLIIDEGLSEQQWLRVVEALQARVLPRHPHVSAGDGAPIEPRATETAVSAVETGVADAS
ncbi:MAG: hypothetical protein JNG86_12675 [Verrucomicrobiaceae bacterium]|nr:hypothetical protein [Verrucomicrobiaceae bacterium]